MESSGFRTFSIMLGGVSRRVLAAATVILSASARLARRRDRPALLAGVPRRRPSRRRCGAARDTVAVHRRHAGRHVARRSSVIDQTVSEALRTFGSATAADQLVSPGTLREAWSTSADAARGGVPAS